ncbi:MAG: glycoside hydrolase family 127 protein, partial [Chloroflexi bacterium]|nr:glycoside hydrolase family 127 protein [Chloroflexota bacterium]
MSTRRLLPLDRVRIHDRFWAPRQETNRSVTLPLQYRILQDTGRIDAFRLGWQPGQPRQPHQFWDSDVAKWIEAAGYSLATHSDPDLMARVDAVIDLIAAAQQPDGYLNIYYSVVEPGQRWTNLRDMHELYCAGHLIEGAVAYYQGTGKRTLLDVMCRYADHIEARFGPREGQTRGYPGHEEIELALVKLYRITGVERYLRLAQSFVNERGRQPHYYDAEALARGEDPATFRFRDYSYNQSHLPIREQAAAEGHSVRAMYYYSGVADVAAECGDDTLRPALERLWENVTRRRMYVTGGIGSSSHGERFTYDYDLPNDTAYTETCAAIGLAFWAQRMLLLDPIGDYGDVLERALYNGILAGVSLDGRSFFYSNPLEADRLAWEAASETQRQAMNTLDRQGWFRCACCPPNVARLLASLGAYVYAQDDDTAYVHLYMGSTANLHVGKRDVRITQGTDYPWSETVRIRVQPSFTDRFTLALRIPGWCRTPRLAVNGEPVALEGLVERGYARLNRVWE